MSAKLLYPCLWQFFEGAFQTNSGGHAREVDFTDFTPEHMQRAEEELGEVCGMFGVTARTIARAAGGEPPASGADDLCVLADRRGLGSARVADYR